MLNELFYFLTKTKGFFFGLFKRKLQHRGVQDQVAPYHCQRNKSFIASKPALSLAGLLIVSTLVVSCGGESTNSAPTAVVGSDKIVDSNGVVTLSGSGNDTDGTIESYLWSQEGGTNLSLSNANTATATFTAPEVSTAINYTLKLTVTDNQGASGSDQLIVTVNPAPIGLLTPTLSAVSANEQITLNWSAIADAASYTLCHATQSLGSPADMVNCAAYTNGTLVQNLGTGANGTSHTVTGLTNGTTYYFALIAVDASGNKSLPSALVLAAPVVAPGKLNDTGITWGGNYPSGNNDDCTGVDITQQDCSHGRDATHNDDSDGHAGFSFTKIDASGTALSASASPSSPWSCVQDNVTGLTWEVKTAALDGIGLHDNADRYNWYNTNNDINGGAVGYADDDGNICEGYSSGQPATYCNTQAFTARVNKAGLCGANDWRLPTITELKGIVNNGTTSPAIDTAYFPNTVSTVYWSSSPDANASLNAWNVNFYYGSVYSNYRDYGPLVRLVRSGQ